VTSTLQGHHLFNFDLPRDSD